MTLALEHITDTWPRVLEHIRTPENARGLRTWLSPDKVRPMELDGSRLVLACPTALMVNIIRERYAALLCDGCSAVLGVPISEVVGRVSSEASQAHQHRIAEQRPAPSVSAPASSSTVEGALRAWGRGFKALSDFIVGSSNRLAFDAVSRIVDLPQDPINPLFIHGASGLGKTHLLQGLALAFRARHPAANVLYLRCEQFTNDFIAACDGGPAALHAFRVRLRHADLLLMDDLHFLSRGQMKKSKDELFDTFNVLADSGKKVVITSDAAPGDIKYLEDRFVQRFSGGLVAPLDRPDPMVRRGIARAKAASHQSTLPEEAVDYIADHITDNIRELEGAVNKLIYMARSFRREPDLALARQALADLIGHGGEEPRLKVILRAVADYFDLRVEDITGKARGGNCSRARHVAIYAYKSSGADTYAAVGNAFGGRTHSAVAYSCEQALALRGDDQALDRFLEDLLLRVRR